MTDLYSTTQHGDEVNAISMLLTKLFRKEIVQAPQKFVLGNDIQAHIVEVENYCRIGTIASDEEKISILLNSLHDDVKNELIMLYEYDAHATEYDWICKKLCDLHKTKVSRTKPIMELLKVNQKNNQKVSDFVREIRREAAKSIKHLNVETRERYMIKTLMKGLKNRRLASSLKELGPTTLDEALEMIKYEVSEEETFESDHEEIHLVRLQRDHLLEKVENLEKRITLLENMVKKNKTINHMRHDTHRELNFTRNKEKIRCYNCDKQGHTSRQCLQRKVCFKCKGDHFQRQCPKNNLFKEQKVNMVQQELLENNKFAPLDNDQFDYYEDSNQSDNSNPETVLCVENANVYKSSKRSSNTVKSNKQVIVDDIVLNQHVSYINGVGKKPKQPLHNVNKPVVTCRFYGKQGDTLLDTGATCNLMDSKFLRKVEDDEFKMTINQNDRHDIKCANASRLKCIGSVMIPFSIGGSTQLTKFFVVDDLSAGVPVILGLRSMKKMDIHISVKNDSAFINSVAIPFKTTIVPATTIIAAEN